MFSPIDALSKGLNISIKLEKVLVHKYGENNIIKKISKKKYIKKILRLVFMLSLFKHFNIKYMKKTIGRNIAKSLKLNEIAQKKEK